MAKLIDRGQLQDLVARGAQLVEALPAKEYEEDHLPGARSIPLRDINRESAASQLVEALPAKEYEEDHLPGARSIPLRDINRESAASLDPHRPVIVYCWDSA